MRIGFLFNHDQTHQVAHSLPVALALARCDPASEVIIAVTSDALAQEVRRLGGEALRQSGIKLQELGIRSWVRRLLVRASASVAPVAKILVYGDNLDFFRTLDVLVVAEKTSLLLRTHFHLNHLKLVHTRHGAGDRAIGFDPASAKFDLVLASGSKIRDRLIRDAGVDAGRIRVVGYPKFEIASTGRAPFTHDGGDDRPIVLYNPHVSPHLSSWYAMGRDILNWFVEHDDYRLIFAPHVMLFHRRFVLSIDKFRIDRGGPIDERVRHAPHIHVDLASPASTDMTYTRCADIYLGDVSSQLYEFLETPRPCAFVDAHHTDWRGDPNYAHWATGPVIGQVSELGAALAYARSDPDGIFKSTQQRLFESSFDLSEEPSSDRAAHAIATFAHQYLAMPIGSQISAIPLENEPQTMIWEGANSPI
jgi:hypothetical protein